MSDNYSDKYYRRYLIQKGCGIMPDTVGELYLTIAAIAIGGILISILLVAMPYLSRMIAIFIANITSSSNVKISDALILVSSLLG